MTKLKRWLAFCAVALSAGLFLLGLIQYALANYDCSAKWGDSGLEYRYTLRGGCKVKAEKGWVPSENYRVQ